jgi:hypothetical protein
MQMFWHESKGVQQESTLVSVPEYCVNQEFRVRSAEKERSPLKRHGRDGVSTDSSPRIYFVRAYPDDKQTVEQVCEVSPVPMIAAKGDADVGGPGF